MEINKKLLAQKIIKLHQNLDSNLGIIANNISRQLPTPPFG